MKAEDWRAISDICIAVAGILLLVGGVAIIYPENRLFVRVYPYQGIGIVVVVSSIILFIVAYVTHQRFNEERELQTSIQIVETSAKEKFFCRYCGEENKPDAKFCESCGKQLT